ncbi:ThiF family adenylyltransferase [Microbispora corallina]|uniref:Thiamine/molybdopterin biosynthesis protein n=1 Tax=Microbispora corallina TaxID=83302 RepID=A0ABQ4GCH5_9ACTN|nr:ThiF family adenylyltransferase [Microbispora corallina]GIH44791.1 thiamine/molybdopterin biosynthesis protein [Microbispora corallina]
MPKVKPEHKPFRLAGGTVRIGGDTHGIAAEIDDPEGWVWTALHLMDGTHDPDTIATLLSDRFADLPSVRSTAIVSALMASGYVEDAAAIIPSELSERELDRYSRSRAFFRRVDLTPREHDWELQLKLKRSRAVVLGLGGTGSHVAWALAAVGVGEIHCVDPDRIELSNLNRQILYTEDDIGQFKADVAANRISRVNSDVTVTRSRERVESEGDLARLVDGYDVLALCADEPRGAENIKVWASRACAAAGVPWAGGGYSGPVVTCGVFAPPEGACYECVSAQATADRPPEIEVDLGGPGVIAFSAGISGQMVAQSVVSLITGVPDPMPGTLRAMNLAVLGDHDVFQALPRADCTNCHPLTSSVNRS